MFQGYRLRKLVYDFAKPQRPHRRPYSRLLGRPYTLLYVKRAAGRLVYPGQNCDGRENLRNLIGCLEYWELEKKSRKKSKPRLANLKIYMN